MRFLILTLFGLIPICSTVRINGLQGVRNEQAEITAAGVTFLPEWSTPIRGNTFRFALNDCVLDATGQQVYANLHIDGQLGSLYVVGEGNHDGQELRRGKLNRATRDWLEALLTGARPGI